MKRLSRFQPAGEVEVGVRQSRAIAMPEAAPATARRALERPSQHTVAAPVTIGGRGLLLGEEATTTIVPAPANHGIVFERVDLDPPVQIPASLENVARRARRTTLKLGSVSIETVEHCMSAFAGLGIDNALVRVDGPELPCGDGSAAPFVVSTSQIAAVMVRIAG